MTPSDFTTALDTLGLDNHQAAAWLGVSVKSVRRYRVSGAPGPVAGMVRQALVIKNLVMWVGVLEEIHGELKGGAKEAFIDAQDSLALDWRE